MTKDLKMSIKTGTVKTQLRYMQQSLRYGKKEHKELTEILDKYEKGEVNLRNDQFIEFMEQVKKHEKNIEYTTGRVKEYKDYLKGVVS